MCFVLKNYSFALYVAFLTAIPYGFVFKQAFLHISCVFLALATANANIFNKIKMFKSVQNTT